VAIFDGRASKSLNIPRIQRIPRSAVENRVRRGIGGIFTEFQAVPSKLATLAKWNGDLNACIEREF
jgi:hypothetical protein